MRANNVAAHSSNRGIEIGFNGATFVFANIS